MTTTAFAFDLDGTVTSIELLPAIAAELGLSEEMNTLTKATLSGLIPFEASFRLRCAILRSVPISRVRAIASEVTLNPEIARFIADNRERCFVVTGNLDAWVSPLIDRLGCRAYTSLAKTEGDALLNVTQVLNKSVAINDLRKTFQRVISIGESFNDVPMFEAADIAISFGGIHDPVPAAIEHSNYVTYDGGALCRLLSTL